MNDARVWIRKYANTPYWTFVLNDSRLFVVQLDYVRAYAMIGLFIGTWAHCTGESRKILLCAFGQIYIIYTPLGKKQPTLNIGPRYLTYKLKICRVKYKERQTDLRQYILS